jgi:hypothetical protein
MSCKSICCPSSQDRADRQGRPRDDDLTVTVLRRVGQHSSMVISTSIIAMAEDLTQSKTRHIEFQYHYTREKVADGGGLEIVDSYSICARSCGGLVSQYALSLWQDVC